MNRIKIVLILFWFVGIGLAEEVVKDPKTGRNIPTKKMADGSVWFMREWSGNQGFKWEHAVNACPSGWHLPSKKEWLKLNELLKEDGRLIEEFRAFGNSRHWWSSSRYGRRFVADLCSAEGDKFVCNETDISEPYSIRCVKNKE